MKKVLITSIKTTAMIAILILTATIANAQFGIGGPGTNGSGINANGTTNGTPTVPFDGGMSLMLAASGIGYAAKKLRRKQ
jgi:hypothetical protein